MPQKIAPQQQGAIVLSHLSFGVADLTRAAAFYDGALAPLGYVRVWSNEDGVGYGVAGEIRMTNSEVKQGAARKRGPLYCAIGDI